VPVRIRGVTCVVVHRRLRVEDQILSPLTPRGRDILRELMTGATNQQIAEVLGGRAKTVMHHSVSIYSQLGVRGRTEGTAWAYRNGISARSDDHAG